MACNDHRIKRSGTTACECKTEGRIWCERHQCHKTAHWVHLCQTRPDYFPGVGGWAWSGQTMHRCQRLNHLVGGPGTELKYIIARRQKPALVGHAPHKAAAATTQPDGWTGLYRWLRKEYRNRQAAKERSQSARSPSQGGPLRRWRWAPNARKQPDRQTRSGNAGNYLQPVSAIP